MKRSLTTLLVVLLCLLATMSARAALTLSRCLEKAEENYPLIKKYGLLEQTADISLSDINKGWLPRIGVYAQATAQNVVPQFPETLQNVLDQMGQDMKGLGKVQYKLGVDVSQTIWDGGASKANREIQRASLAEQKSSLDVAMYDIRQRVMNLYFGILLMEEQTKQTENTIRLLEANKTIMQSLLRGGVAMQSDVDIVEAQLLTMRQQLTTAKSAVESYKDMLSIYVGEDISGQTLEKPGCEMPASFESARPELALYDARKRLNTARENAVESSLMPRIGFFAQAYYGYPGFNYFESMINRKLSFNLLAGVKISWNIDSFYTKRNSLRNISLANENVANERDVFLFNSRLQASSELEEISGLRKSMADDGRIVELRANVRQAAESQLRNGVIDATALLAKITDENQARLTAAYHEIQLLQKIYNLKNTLNR